MPRRLADADDKLDADVVAFAARDGLGDAFAQLVELGNADAQRVVVADAEPVPPSRLALDDTDAHPVAERVTGTRPLWERLRGGCGGGDGDSQRATQWGRRGSGCGYAAVAGASAEPLAAPDTQWYADANAVAELLR